MSGLGGAPLLLELPEAIGRCMKCFQRGEETPGTAPGSVLEWRNRVAALGLQASSSPAGLRAVDSRMAVSTAARS
jgi:hypothetical protein